MDENGYAVLLRNLDEVGRAPARSLPELDRTPDPWERSLQATFECLSWRGSLDNLERRRAEDDLGETVYGRFPVHCRPAVVAAHSLLDKGIITEDELEAKMRDVRERFNAH
jgi:hypothetical protein